MMRNYAGPLVRGWVLIVIIACGGCLLLERHYTGKVLAHISPQPVDSLHVALEGMGGLEGPWATKTMEDGRSCRFYNNRLLRSAALVSVTECFGPTQNSETGWGYSVFVNAGNENRDDVRQEVDELLARIQNTIKAKVGSAKVTLETLRFYFW